MKVNSNLKQFYLSDINYKMAAAWLKEAIKQNSKIIVVGLTGQRYLKPFYLSSGEIEDIERKSTEVALDCDYAIGVVDVDYELSAARVASSSL